MKQRVLIPHRIIPRELYVMRDADRQLQSILEDMASPGYVLVSRQMGKTNLLLNAKRTYQLENDIFTYIDLSNSFDSEYECFRNIVDKAIETNSEKIEHLRVEILSIRERKLPAHLEHLYELRLILRNITGKMVIILDEIDALTRSTFSDKIFSQIRSIYFERDSYEELNRLTYILSGVMEPTEIIRDPKISPFNIGQKIFLDDFSFEEHLIFLDKAVLDVSEDVSKRIFDWTSGNPRMTYDICSELEKLIIKGVQLNAMNVDEVVKTLYLTLFDKAPIDHIRELTESSRIIRDAITIIRYGRGSQLDISTKTKLYLAGIIGSDFTSENLGIKNRIINESLSENWISEIEKKAKDIDSLIIDASSQKEYQNAIDFFVKRNDLDIKLSNGALYHIGVSYFRMGEFAKATDILLQVEFDPEYEKSFYLDTNLLLAESYLEDHKELKSIEILKDIVERDRDGSFYFLAIIALGKIYLDFEKSKNISLSIEYFSEVLNSIAKFNNSFSNDEADNLLVSVHLYYGIALGKINDLPNAFEQLDEAFKKAEPYSRPAILLARRNIERDLDTKLVILDEILNIIFGEELLPDPEPDSLNLFSNEVLYTIFNEVHHNLQERFEELCRYLLKDHNKNRTIDYGERLMSIVLIGVSKSNRELVYAICEFILFNDNSSKFGADVIHSAFQLLVVGGPPVLERIPELGIKYFDFLISNRKYKLTASDLDIFLSMGDDQIGSRNYDGAQKTISFLYDALEKTSDNLKNSRFLVEFMEIRVLYLCEFKEAAKLRSQTLLNQINKLTQQEIVKNPLFKSIDFVKHSLRGFQFPSAFLSPPIRKYSDNERVNVRYHQTNKIVRAIKYKKVKLDLQSGLCTVI